MQDNNNRLLRILFILIWVIAIMHTSAEAFYWYWTYRWFDIPMHYLGGVWVGLAALWIWYYSGFMRKKNALPTKPFIVAVGGGIVFGVAWELYEFLVWIFGGAGLPMRYIPDTALDLVMDTLGVVTAHGVYRYFFLRKVEFSFMAMVGKVLKGSRH
ncbi:MAG: hypothetical protein KBD24_03195 [Candidatus Pacebacteria bacterium]|nr:hypothetical protein [Candidatus Paceibacterota bacterium]